MYVLFSINAWTVWWKLMCNFHLTVYRILSCKCLFVSSMAKPSCIVSCLAFDMCALPAYAQTVALFPGLPSFQLGLSKSIHCSLYGRLHLHGWLANKVNALSWDTVQKRQHYLFIFICLHIPYSSHLSAENDIHIGCPFVGVKGQQSSCLACTICLI